MLEMCEKASPNEIYDYRSLSYHKKNIFLSSDSQPQEAPQGLYSTEEWEVEKPC